MAILGYTTNLSLRLESDSIFLSNGSSVTSWLDLSGNGDFTTVLGTGPTLALNATPTGLPAVQFGGAGGLSGSAVSTIISASVGTIFVVFKATAATANSATPQNNDAILCGSSVTSMGMFVRNNGPNYISWNNDGTNDSNSHAISLDNWYIGIWRHGTGNLLSDVDDVFDLPSTASGNTSTTAVAVQLGENPAGTAWLTGYIAAVLTYRETTSEANMASAINYLASKYLTRGDPEKIVRDVLSRRAWEFGDPKSYVEIRGPLTLLDGELLTDIAIADPTGPSPTTSGTATAWQTRPDGWGGLNYTSRRPVRITQQSVDLNTLSVSQDGKDLWPISLSYWDSFVPTKTSNPIRQGIGIISRESVRCFTRDSAAWIYDAEGGLVTRIEEGAEKTQAGGVLIETYRKNQLSKSAFVSGTSSLTLSGTGVNGSAIAVSTTDPLLFDTSVSPNSVMLTAGNPHTTPLLVSWPATSQSVYSCYVRFETRNVTSSSGLVYRLQRTIDGAYFNFSSSWGSLTPIDNNISFAPSATTVSQTILKFINGALGPISAAASSAGASPLILTIGMSSGGTASRVSHLYYADILTASTSESIIAGLSSRIVTDAAPVAQDSDLLWMVDNSTGVTMRPERGTIMVRTIPQWSGSDLAGFSITLPGPHLLHLGPISTTGDNSAFAFYYNNTTAAPAGLVFSALSSDGSVLSSANFSHVAGLTITAGQEYSFAFRWTSTAGELGSTGRLLSVFVDGVKGTDANTTGFPASGSSLSFYSPRTTSFSTKAFNAQFKSLVFKPVALTDEEIYYWSIATT